MKSFDPMNPDDEILALEAELRGMAMRHPPAEWKQLLLAPLVPPVPPVPWFPKPLAMALAGCWLAAGAFHLATPEDEFRAAPASSPAPPVEPGHFLLGFNTPRDLIE
jgi:hypothetical protein